MRLRGFLSAGESPRPYSEIVAERRAQDPVLQRRERVLDEIAELEGRAAAAESADERKSLQCEAEALRCALAENAR